MDSKFQNPMVARAQVLMLALLAAGIWVVLSVLGAGESAVADDSDAPGTFLGPVTDSVSKVVPVPATTESAIAVVERVTDQASQLGKQSQVPEHSAAAVEHVVPDAAANVAHKATSTVTTAVASTVTGAVSAAVKKSVWPLVEPVLQLDVVVETVRLLDGAVETAAGPLVRHDITDGATSPLDRVEPTEIDMDLLSSTRADAVSAAATYVTRTQPLTGAEERSGPAAVAMVEANDPRQTPVGPMHPMSPESLAPTPAPSAHSLHAVMPDFAPPSGLVAALYSSANYALPSSPTYDTDTAPD